MADEFMIAKDLQKSFNDFKAVDGVSFSIYKGEIFGKADKPAAPALRAPLGGAGAPPRPAPEAAPKQAPKAE